MKKSNRIVLLGGAGLVGQNLIVQLKQLEYTNLVVIDKHASNLKILQKIHPEITTECADLADSGNWEKLVASADVVVMLQAQIGGNDFRQFQRNNIDSTQNVLNTMKPYQVPYLIHISSSVVESIANDWYTETKKEQERLVVQSGQRAAVLRPTLMFGWFDRKHLGWLSRFMRKVPIFPIPGHGRYMRQPLYVGDFCKIIANCINNKTIGLFNITGQEKINYINIIYQIKIATRARSMIFRIPYWFFYLLLRIWAIFDQNPPFTTQQLAALVAHDEFDVIDWPNIFGVTATPFVKAIDMTFNHPVYSSVVLDF